MNIIHNSSQKFIPNQLFQSPYHHQHEYIPQNKLSKEDSNKQNTSECIKKSIKFKKPLKFKDKTNIGDDVQIKQFYKPNSIVSLLTNQVNIRSSLAKQVDDVNTAIKQKQNDTSHKVKARKKVSPKKNNLKQLFLEIEQKSQQDCIFTENTQKIDKIQVLQNIKQNKLEEKEQTTIQINKIDQIDEKNELKQQQYNQLNKQCQQQQFQKQYVNSQKSLFKMNKFHFLHNELNFDTSSDEQCEVNNQSTKSIKRSSSSQNESSIIDYDLPKIRQRNNFFINKQDLDFDSSNSQQQDDNSNNNNKDNKQNPSIKQIPYNKDSIKQINDQQLIKQKGPKSSRSSRAITVADFRRQFVSTNQEYLKKSLPIGISLDLIVRRDKSKKHSNSTQYQLYDGKTLRMLAIVNKKSGVHQILAKTNIENPKAHPDLKYLTAKLESNFLGSQFTLKYVPKNNSPNHKNKDSSKQQIASTICYQTNILGLKGPRKISIYIPEQQSVKYYGDKSLQEMYEKKCWHKIQKYVNKQAKWNHQVQSYVLNLKGKAKLSSVKNFVIVKDQAHLGQGDDLLRQQRSYVIFGKGSKDIFNLSISGPFSIVQGLSVALSTFERKFTCQ